MSVTGSAVPATAAAASASGPPAVAGTAPPAASVPVPLPSVADHAINCGLADDVRDAMLAVLGATVTTPLKVFTMLTEA